MDDKTCATKGKTEQESFKDRWPDRPAWDVRAQSIETLAKACGGSAQCHKKYEYLSVSLETGGMPKAQFFALQSLAELVEQVSDAEDHGAQSTVHWVCSVLGVRTLSRVEVIKVKKWNITVNLRSHWARSIQSLQNR